LQVAGKEEEEIFEIDEKERVTRKEGGKGSRIKAWGMPPSNNVHLPTATANIACSPLRLFHQPVIAGKARSTARLEFEG
jgi:hypothetical protein